MIFKKLFRPKHQDVNPKVRIDAISGFSPDNPEQKSLLHELAFNDEDAGVNLAALNRLNSFALWNKVADTAKQERVRKKASQIVESALLGEGELKLSEKERKTFVSECKNVSLLEKLIKQPWLLNGDAELILQVLETIDKPHLTLHVFFQSGHEELQQALVDKFDDEQTLQKVIKKAQSESVKALAQGKIDKLVALKEKPLILEKRVKLVLSQLLALKDKNDYQDILQRRQKLDAEYHELSQQYVDFTPEQAELFKQKYSDIVVKLDKWLQGLKPQWQEAQLKDEQQQGLDEAGSQLNAIITQVTEALENGAQSITLGQVERFENSLSDIQQSLKSLSEQIPASEHAQHTQLETLFNQVNGCKVTLESLPEFQNAIENARIFLDEFKSLALPADLSQLDASHAYLKEQKAKWKALTGHYAQTWPAELISQWQSLNTDWSAATKALRSQLDEELSRCKNKLRVVDNMISQGRFKPAISLFAKVSGWYQALPENAQVKLSRQFEKTKGQVENLIDWQDYIAQPRKPALLAEAETLISSPLDVEEQAKKVKSLRQQWNSLGKVNTESDQALNDAFEQTLEKAFEPCRTFYAQRQQEREDNLKTRHDLINQIIALGQENKTERDLHHGFRELQSKWQNAGEVDFKQMDEIHTAYRDACDPIVKRINRYHQQNADQKLQLIRKAEKLLSVENVYEAVDAAKQLQGEWKNIGPASKKAEGKLWSEFRRVNDSVFARRKEQQQEVKQEVEQKSEQILQFLNERETALNDASDKQALHRVFDDHAVFRAMLDGLPIKHKGRYEKAYSALVDRQHARLKQLEQEAQSEQFRTLFEKLNNWTEAGIPENLENIASQWRNCFSQTSQELPVSRQELTIKLEILSDKPSPKDESGLRQQIQLKMMADKLQQGEQQDKHTLLKQWIGQGPLSEADQQLLPRIEDIFTSAP